MNKLRLWFVLKCAFVTGLIMFLSMAAGELIIDSNLFSGFLRRPSLWFGIFTESAVWTIPICIAGLFILERVRTLNRNLYMAASIGVWTLLGALIVVVYKIFYWPRAWKLTSLEPGIIFGWAIPCVLTLIFFSIFSLRLYDSRNGRQLA